MAITTLSMVLTVFVLNLHEIKDRPVPLWVKKLVLIYLARMMGICYKFDADSDARIGRPRNRRNGGVLGNRAANIRRASLRIDSNGEDRTAIFELHPCGNSSVTANSDTERTSLMHDKDDETVTVTSSAGGTPRHTPHNTPRHHGNSSNYGSNLTNHNPRFSNFTYSQPYERPKPADIDYAKDWKKVAEVFDRLFFWLFLFAILISTLVLFHPLSDAYMRRKIPPHR